jgi:hypothetical protein
MGSNDLWERMSMRYKAESVSSSKLQPTRCNVSCCCILLAVIWNYIMIYGHMNIRFTNFKQAKEAYQYRNIKNKLYKANAAARNVASCWL